MMRDLLFRFSDEASAHAALDPLGFGSAEGWDQSRVLPVSLMVDWMPGPVDPETGVPTKIPVRAEGYWIVVSVAGDTDALYAIPECMREADREAAERHEPYVIRERFTAEQLAVPWSITPQWCGVQYRHPQDPPADAAS
jgi:hypothetical protein